MNEKNEKSPTVRVIAMCALGTLWFLAACAKVVGQLLTLGHRHVAQSLEKGGLAQDAVTGLSPGTSSSVIERDFGSDSAVRNHPAPCIDFQVADRNIRLQLQPEVGVVNLRIYYAQKLIKRELIITEPRLRALMQGRRHTLPDHPYEPNLDLRRCERDSVKLAEELINRVGRTNVVYVAKRQKPETARGVTAPPVTPKAEPAQLAESSAVAVPLPSAAPSGAIAERVEVMPVAVSMPAQEAVAVHTQKLIGPPINGLSAPTVQAAALSKPVVPVGERFDPRPTPGTRFEGLLVSAGSITVSQPGRAPYKTFEARLRLSNGIDLPMRGWELAREIERAGVKIGQVVAITPMGRVPVDVAGGARGEKNMYAVCGI